MPYIIQISDTHLFGDKNRKINGSNSYENLKLVLNHIAALNERPELIIVTGDLSQDCTFESYQFLSNLLDKTGIKYYFLPGNHDDVDILNKVFDFQWIKNEADYSIEFKNYLFYIIDTSLYPNDYGELSGAQLLKFEKYLNENKNKQTIVFMHHHPILIESPWLDAMMLKQADKFNSIIKNHPQIKAVLFGHIHQVVEQKINGTYYASAPATCYQALAKTKMFTVEKHTPGYRIIEINGDKFNTKVIWVE
ncbi:MAG: hypothetical protein A3B68_00140 [Candidatus Melainabacteria bacterium RIFCSPHIGHO2_02_FULL_34_12]|nr:MAG: hypothetical protein A3B68_00140 [Candidatus Melainabacteria bacterium RIFCSPHIGHO2_02_FULL_34_12]